MPTIGPMEVIIVLVVALLILGPKRLPAAGRSLGRSIQEFKSGLVGGRRDDTPAISEVSTNASPKPRTAAESDDHQDAQSAT